MKHHFGFTRRAVDTDLLNLPPSLLRRLLDSARPTPAGCLMSDELIVQVGLRGTPEPHGISVARAVYAMTHPREHVAADEYIAHTCPAIGEPNDPDRPTCIEPGHLCKIPGSQAHAWNKLKRQAS